MIDARQILLPKGKAKAIPLHVVSPADAKAELTHAGPAVAHLAKAAGFAAAPMSVLQVANARGVIESYYVGAPAKDADPFTLGQLASRLPPGHYRFSKAPENPDLVALGWCLELYRFNPMRPVSPPAVTLEAPQGTDAADIIRKANATYQVRDLINMPANLFGPAEIEAAARTIARAHGARFKVIAGPALRKGFPLIHAVGAASTRAPRLIDFSWGSPRNPKVTLVGKGVCFDTGGLDIKPSSGMLLMKKDMGGAACVLGLARLIMEAKLPVRLRVLVPAVENAIAGQAFRPGDVFRSRKGLTVEIGNTDAEGRLILADALALADEEKPDLIIDLATLTGAARVALGPDLPPFYTDDDELASQIHTSGSTVNDPLWRLPLWQSYNDLFSSPIADLNNSSASGFAGSITAALFLKRFVTAARHHVHADIFGWVPAAKPGRPKGGEAQAMRALFSLIQRRYNSRLERKRNSGK